MRRLLSWSIAVLFATPALAGDGDYAMRLLESGEVEISRGDMRTRLRPQFTVIGTTRDPQLRLSQNYTSVRAVKGPPSPEAYPVPTWAAGGAARTDTLFDAGIVTETRAKSWTIRRGVIRWRFAATADFSTGANPSSPIASKLRSRVGTP